MDTREKLSKNEFIMIRSLGKQGSYRLFEEPLWRVGRHWGYDYMFELEARAACESLLRKGLVDTKRLYCCSHHINLNNQTLYVLSPRGKAFLERANQPRLSSVIEPVSALPEPPTSPSMPGWIRNLLNRLKGPPRISPANEVL